jgi:hypothetical protein
LSLRRVDTQALPEAQVDSMICDKVDPTSGPITSDSTIRHGDLLKTRLGGATPTNPVSVGVTAVET